MSDEQFESRVGTWLRDKWKLDRLIAVGGMAGVFEASHKIGRKAAIKVLRSEIAADKGIRKRFEQEAAAVNSINHHAVVQVLDVDEDDDGTPFLVMELLEGETLADRVEREKTLKTDLLLDIVDQLLDVLIACHKKGIIHRDIKPENLFILANGRLKVLDFGIARVREGVRTVAGTMLGTVAFMPPEQLKGQQIDARADLFAVGATMFAVIAGRRLHLAEDDAELAMQMLTQPSPRLATVADAPEPVCLVVDRALAYLPKRRYPDAQTMRGDVWAARRGERPPYAQACERAGQAPDVLKEEEKPTSSKTRPDRARAEPLPSTDPQMPVFVDLPKSGPHELPSTNPQMPVFVADGASKPEAKGARATSAAPAESAASTNSAASAKSTADAGAEAAGEAPQKPSRTASGWPPEKGSDEAADEGREARDSKPSSDADPDDAPDRGEPESDGASTEVPTSDATAREDVPADSDSESERPKPSSSSARDSDSARDDHDSLPPDSDPAPSSDAPSVPPQGELPPVDAEAVARRQGRNYGFVVVVLLLLGAGAYAAWYQGLFNAPKAPKPAPTQSPG